MGPTWDVVSVVTSQIVSDVYSKLENVKDSLEIFLFDFFSSKLYIACLQIFCCLWFIKWYTRFVRQYYTKTISRWHYTINKILTWTTVQTLYFLIYYTNCLHSSELKYMKDHYFELVLDDAMSIFMNHHYHAMTKSDFVFVILYKCILWYPFKLFFSFMQ